MIKKTLSLLVVSVMMIQSAYAAQATSFIVEVSPSSASVNQAVDLKVKAVDANGVVVKDYTNNIYIEVPGIKDLQDISLPGDGIYTFSPQDQGEKTFSKGLTIKSPGTYTLQVSDIETDSIKGQTTITVQAAGGQTTTNTSITFSSPLAGSTETNSTVSVVGNAGVKNAKVQLFLNGKKIKEEQANQNGDFTSFLTSLEPGDYVLQAKVQDVNDKIIAQSENLSFAYQPTQVGALQGFDILPSKTLKQGQKATYTVRVSSDTTSVELVIHDTASGKTQKLTLDKTSDGVFGKQLLMDTAGTFSIDVNYSVGKDTKTQASAATVSVLEGKGIKEVTYVVDPLDKTKLSLGWKPIGDVQYVLVQQGTDKDALGTGVLLTGSTGQIQGIDVSKQSYFIRVFPANEKSEIIGEPSDIILIEQVQGSAPVCRIQGISVSTSKIGDQYFLSWGAAENAERYIVYRSDRPVNSIADMQKVGETSDTRFPYPFDPAAKKEGYAYYAVVAICQDGNALQLGSTKKVKVGPATNMMLILLISIMIFGIARMRKVSN